MADFGRPTEYEPEFAGQAEKLCLLGATDEEIGDFFGVSARTIYRWKLRHPDFCQALKSGKEQSDERIERGLFQKAVGHYVIEQQAIKVKDADGGERVEVVDVERYVPPDTTAAIFWLKNRRKESWRDKQEFEFTNPIDEDALDAAIARKLASMAGYGQKGTPRPS